MSIDSGREAERDPAPNTGVPPQLANAVFLPLYPVAFGRCTCGDPGCKRRYKHPKPYADGTERDEDGAAIKTGKASGLFVVDVDIKGGVNGYDQLTALGPLPTTLTVRSPSGGAHFYFRHPGFPVRNRKLDTAIDIRGDEVEEGKLVYVVAPDSPGLDMQGGLSSYEVVEDAPLAEAPEWLLSWLRIGGEERDGVTVTPITKDDPLWTSRYTKAKEAAETYEPSRADGNASKALMTVAKRLVRDLELPLDTATELLEVHWNPRCTDTDGNPYPWPQEDIARALERSATLGTSEPGTLKETVREAVKGIKEHMAGRVDDAPRNDVEDPDNPLGFLQGGLDDEPQPVDWLIEGILARGKVALFYGDGYVGKSWAALDAAVAVANGRPWLGKFPAVKGKAAYLDYEMGDGELKARLRVLGDARAKGEGVLRLSNCDYLLDDKDLWGCLDKMHLDVLVIDSLSAGNPLEEESNSKFANPIKVFATRLAHTTGCVVIFIHHSTKNGSGRTSIRGSGAIYNGAEISFEFAKAPNASKKELHATVSNDKFRVTGAQAPDDFTIVMKGNSLTVAGESERTPHVEKNVDHHVKALCHFVNTKGHGACAEELKNFLRGRGVKANDKMNSIIKTCIEKKDGGIRQVKEGKKNAHYPTNEALDRAKVRELVADETKFFSLDDAERLTSVPKAAMRRWLAEQPRSLFELSKGGALRWEKNAA